MKILRFLSCPDIVACGIVCGHMLPGGIEPSRTQKYEDNKKFPISNAGTMTVFLRYSLTSR
ncbi:hypothetical protein CFR74_12765 [Novacetimonas hansenii]|nr:hypothetical protein CFR74_12765 [Novacetimonas hansenii]RFP03094.1 hypothetical protein BGC30_03275 [Novacetimonas hansenii]